ncbi:hypothetical protein M5D96_013832 [Drosophila gunungcola]|uniref:Uncharacterized protein n=1 Tax=Drosophila gunungcola TaxID=103775 RepID=A0A9Q0BIR7_9MUSC|nr:hypothetical protein M5D96_013832 [Drosophila gunungcola]
MGLAPPTSRIAVHPLLPASSNFKHGINHNLAPRKNIFKEIDETRSIIETNFFSS